MRLLDVIKNFSNGGAQDRVIANTFQKLPKEINSIPEPTRSLLFYTNEPIENRVSSMGYEMKIVISDSGVKLENNDAGKKKLFAEPSLIWLRLRVEKNRDKNQDKIYYPTYFDLSPRSRYEYLCWLKDVTQPTNLSYVFLYYYGLERHLVLGKYDLAVSEINRLVKYHDKGTFKSYVSASLIAASLYHKRYDVLDKISFLRYIPSNPLLYLLYLSGNDISVEQIIELVYRVGFKNTRYLKLKPEIFTTILSERLADFTKNNGSVLSKIDVENIKKEKEIYFANLSFPRAIREIETPQFFKDNNFCAILLSLLQDH